MPHIIITPGDAAGIGLEVIAKALDSPNLPPDATYEVLPHPSGITLGMPNLRSAQASWDALEIAAARLIDGTADAVVTGPVSKEQLQKAGFPFPGQTEFFTARFGYPDTTMCLSGKHLTVALCTIHDPLARVSKLLSEEQIIRTARLLHDFLLRCEIKNMRIAICGLNPHAGENGTFGDEEQRIISPAVVTLQHQHPGIFSGPHVPDAVFREAYLGHYDAVVCMYHDQGLIPLKLLDFDNAVNITLGLPKPRVSPDHGTAFSIAGKNRANPSSMIRALQVAAEMTRYNQTFRAP
jgi:4-hydroxythreonine-4-phosphate dehydrogenase